MIVKRGLVFEGNERFFVCYFFNAVVDFQVLCDTGSFAVDGSVG